MFRPSPRDRSTNPVGPVHERRAQCRSRATHADARARTRPLHGRCSLGRTRSAYVLYCAAAMRSAIRSTSPSTTPSHVNATTDRPSPAITIGPWLSGGSRYCREDRSGSRPWVARPRADRATYGPMSDDLSVMSFGDGSALREWLVRHHRESRGLWVRVFNSRSGVSSVTFQELLEQGLCFGWSESKRVRGDETFYLQRFTPRRRPGTNSSRNRRLVQRLLADGAMTESGLRALGLLDVADPAEQALLEVLQRGDRDIG